MHKRPLTKKQQAFVEYYLQCWNAAEAARRAGYSVRSARSIGHENLTKPDIQLAIESRVQDLQMGTDEILARLTEQARGLGAKYIEQDGRVNLLQIVRDGNEHLLKGVKYNAKGHLIVELYDAQVALDKLARIRGLYKPKKKSPARVQAQGFQQILEKVYGDKADDDS